jgi:hypothetical protein
MPSGVRRPASPGMNDSSSCGGSLWLNCTSGTCRRLIERPHGCRRCPGHRPDAADGHRTAGRPPRRPAAAARPAAGPARSAATGPPSPPGAPSCPAGCPPSARRGGPRCSAARGGRPCGRPPPAGPARAPPAPTHRAGRTTDAGQRLPGPQGPSQGCYASSPPPSRAERFSLSGPRTTSPSVRKSRSTKGHPPPLARLTPTHGQRPRSRRRRSRPPAESARTGRGSAGS